MNEVNASVFMEYGRASEQYGQTNHSHHESYAIILEEVEEAMEAADIFEETLESYWQCIRTNQEEEALAKLKILQGLAAETAAEWIQVAAMCYKAQKVAGRKGA